MKSIYTLAAALLLTGILGFNVASAMADEPWDEEYEATNEFVNDSE